MNFLGIKPSTSIDITLNNLTNRKVVEARSGHQPTRLLPVFYDGESICGNVTITLKRGSKLEYQCIKIELIGHIDFFTDRGSRDEFLNKSQDLARPGILSQSSTTYPFHFDSAEMPFESYTGSNVHLRYFLRVTVVKRFMDLTKELDILVHSFCKPQQPDANIQMEVGIEDSLHIEFEYNKSCYHLGDVIVGKIHFLLVRVKIKYMEVQIQRREATGLGAMNNFSETEILAKFEIMDGAPVRGESIPIRLFLGAYDLVPTMKDINRKFSVRYYLNLVLLDEEERRYYKQHEIFLFRRPDKRFETLIQSRQAMALKSTNPQLPSIPSFKQIAPSRSHSIPVAEPPSSSSSADDYSFPQSTDEGAAVPVEIQNGKTTPVDEPSQNDVNGIENPSIDASNRGESDNSLAQPDEAEEHSDDTEASTVATSKNLKEEERQAGTGKDVFGDLSDYEDACNGGLSREQRSFARYESPRNAEADRGTTDKVGNDEVSEEALTKPPPFDSTISAIT